MVLQSLVKITRIINGKKKLEALLIKPCRPVLHFYEQLILLK